MYDEEKANRAISFVKLLRNTQGEYAKHPFNLMPFQEKIVKDLFGTVNDEGFRQFREAFIFLPRKNGKTELIAALVLYCLFMDDEYGAEIYSAATSREQATKVYQACCAMIRMNRALSSRCKIIESQKRIVRYDTNSFYRAISAEAGTAHGFNAHVVIYDEIHEAPNRDLYDVLKTSMGARRQPLFISITTAGADTNGICYELYQYSKMQIGKKERGEEYDTTFYPVIYEAPEDADIWDEKTWFLANPALGVFRSLEEFRQTATRAKEIPSLEAGFRRLYLNQWVNSDVAWMNMSKWHLCNDFIPETELLGRECYCGIDLSATTDLTSVNLEFRLDDDRYVMLSHSFMPENRIMEKEKIDRVPYSVWIKQGYITATPGDVIDYEFVKAYIRNAAMKFQVKEICFDPWNCTQLANDLENEGFILVAVRQGYATLSEPTKDILALVYQKRIIHNQNPVLTWAISNCITRQDPNGNIALDKAKSKNRIDPAAAMVNSHSRARMLDTTIDLNKLILGDEFSF